MSESSTVASSDAPSHARAHYNRIFGLASQIVSDSVLAVICRVSIAAIFFLSGRTKVEGFLKVTDGARELFRTEYKLPFLTPEFAATVSAYAEHLFPVLLVLGLFTRFSALALLLMTGVIQIFVYPDAWPVHLSWAAILLFLAAHGAGPLSIDRALKLK